MRGPKRARGGKREKKGTRQVLLVKLVDNL